MNTSSSFLIKKVLPHLAALLVFVALVLIYFQPLMEGKALSQGDMDHWRGMVEELEEYHRQFPDEKMAWSGSMFSGMPSYQFGVVGYPANPIGKIQELIGLNDPSSVGPVLAGLISAYILCFLLTGNFWIALLGAIAFAFSSYNIIIIQAGHVTKAWAIAWMPLVLSGLLLVMRKKYLTGGALFTFALALELIAMHVQITYYLAIFCLIIYLGYIVNGIIKKNYRSIALSACVLVIGVGLAALPRISGLYSDLEMSKLSTRGASELTERDTSTTSSDGLDRDYAFAWSYGKGETLSVLIPNIRGGASGGALGRDSHLYKEMRANGAQPGKEIRTYTYWGDQPFTSGPVYFGAVICFLFLLGMVVVKHNAKWWLLGAAIFFVILSWGSNMPTVNNFLFEHLPMYNKFRTPSMALVIPGLIFPLVGVWGIWVIIKNRYTITELKKPLLISASITAGICLIFWIMPGLFCNFISANDAQFIDQVPAWYYNALIEDRGALLKSDALRSLIFVLLATAAVFLFTSNKKNVSRGALIGLALLTLIDLWAVDKRYLNDASFTKKQAEKAFQPTAADNYILNDKGLSYRVLNLSVSPFQDSSTSYFHKSIGGYHAAKLGRYQELIDHRLMPEISTLAKGFNTLRSDEDLDSLLSALPSLNMLNTKYIIYNPEAAPIENRQAYGNAWFVDRIQLVDNADAELSALDTIDPLTTAVVDRRYQDQVGTTSFMPDSTASIELTDYRPDYLKYHSRTAAPQLAVFSEVYYEDGWNAYLDGEPVPHFRADWVLRAMNIPAGEHTIEFRFEPETFNRLISLGTFSSYAIIVAFVFIMGLAAWKSRK